jgi:hypothetical protein
MITGMPLQHRGSKDERKLLRFYKSLADSDQQTLLAFAEFLSSRTSEDKMGAGSGVDVQKPLPEPELLPRPEEESVVKAIKRLSASYPMIEKSLLFDKTSSLMTEHILQGRPAKEVIDDIEAMFAETYQQLKAEEEAEAEAENEQPS